jgi:hypothetical protein
VDFVAPHLDVFFYKERLDVVIKFAGADTVLFDSDLFGQLNYPGFFDSYFMVSTDAFIESLSGLKPQ